MGMSLSSYLGTAFPGQIAAGYTTETVSTIEIGNVDVAPFTISGVTPVGAPTGTTTMVTITGAGFVSKFPVFLDLLESGSTVPVADATITMLSLDSSTAMTAEITIDKGAVAREIEVFGRRGDTDDRTAFTILP